MHVVDGILSAQRYRDEIPEAHHLMYNDAQLHVVRKPFLEAENIPVLA